MVKPPDAQPPDGQLMVVDDGAGRSRAASAFDRLLAGEPAALARALSVLEDGGPAADALALRLRPHTGRAFVVGFTGPPGAGKSTLIGAYMTELRSAGERVAVLAVDPSSPLSGGALLGDRLRMNSHVSDPGVFVRSVASGGHLGGLSLTIPLLLDAVDAAGWPIIVLETVGAGQSETEIVDFADVKVVLNAPGLGDDVQAMKAGVLEIADVLVVNKSDLPFADKTKQQIESMLQLRSNDRPLPAVVATSAVRAEGIAELARTIRDGASKDTAPEVRIARRLRGLLTRSVESEVHSRLALIDETRLDDLCASIRDGSVTMPDAIAAVLAAVEGHTGVVDPVEIMRRWWDEVWGEGRLDLIPELVAERYVRHGSNGTVERDHAAFQFDMCQYQRVLNSPTVSLDDVAVNGDTVWSRVTMQGVNLETGEPRTVSWLQVHRIEHSRIAESWVLYANEVDWR